jgi:hypothetical protein
LKNDTVAEAEPRVHEGKRTGISVERFRYRGWPDCYRIANGLVEAVVVPAIGRVMQFSKAGGSVGTLWENPALAGQLPDPASAEWVNYGGEKVWPAPQSAWPEHQGRDWPPPAAFDARPFSAIATLRGVALTSPVDPGYGIQVERRVELDEERPTMRIRTEYRKLYGPPVEVAIWTIAQMREPERVFMLLSEDSRLQNGYLKLMDGEPEGLRIDDRLLSMARHPSENVKIGGDAARLVWVGPTCAVRIDAETGPGEYPDGGCVTQIYTNAGPLAYVEMETLGPLAAMTPGDGIERTAEYTLLERTAADPEVDARKALGLR